MNSDRNLTAEEAVNREWLERFVGQMLAEDRAPRTVDCRLAPIADDDTDPPGDEPEAPRTRHPLGIAGKVLLGAALTGVGMGLAPGVSVAEPVQNTPAPATDVKQMTTQELGKELGRVSGKDSLRTQEVVSEMKLRGEQFFEAAPATQGLGISASVPVRKGVSVTGTLAYDPNNGSVITSLGARLGKPTAPQFTGISPKPDGLNANVSASAKLGPAAAISNDVSLNVSPDGSLTGSYKAKGTVTTPDGRSYEMDVTVERKADGTYNIKTPDGVTTSRTLPDGSTIDVKTPTDQTALPGQPEIKGKAPETGYKSWSSWFDASASVSVDKEFKSTAPLPTPEEVDRAKADWAKAQADQQVKTDQWMAENRPEAVRREGLETLADRAAAIEAQRQQSLPDRDRDGIPDESDATPNQNDTDPTSTDVGDGPEGNPGYTGSTGYSDSGFGNNSSGADLDGDGRTGSADATPNQNDTDPTSTDVGDGPEGNPGYTGSTGYSDSGFGNNSSSVDSGSGSFSGSLDSSSTSGYSDSGFGNNSSSVDSSSADSSSSVDSGGSSSGYSDSGFGDNTSSADTGGGYSDSGFGDSGGSYDSGGSADSSSSADSGGGFDGGGGGW